MRNAEVLFFSADPFSARSLDRPRLLIDEEVRQIRDKVRTALYRDRLHLDANLATRTDDLLLTLNERRPQVVHFSGHGGDRGLVLVGSDPTRFRRVDADALRELFQVFRGDIRLVVLNACWSLPQAEAIRDVIGCAIGTPAAISDDAAIAFSAAFYRAIAFGKSVREAFDQGRTALKLGHFNELEYPQLLHRDDVDPAQLFLIEADPAVPAATSAPVPQPEPIAHRATRADRLRRAVVTVSVLALSGSGAYMLYDALKGDGPEKTQPIMAAVGSTSEGPGAQDLADALNLQAAGNDSAALVHLQRAADAGNEEATAYLGMAYLEGRGTEPQPVLGAQLLRKAAEADNARGMNGLAIAYQRGAGVNRNRRVARIWFQKSADLGFVEAMRNLGILYREEFVADSGYAAVLYWLTMAADSGSTDAMVDLAAMSEAGEGVPRDTAAALQLYTRAANAGSARAMVILGQRHQERGEYAPAREWYLKGANAGSAEAMNNLGILYLNGWGVPADRDEARRLFERAAAAGSAVARANLDALDGG